jgi:hypothetical protein
MIFMLVPHARARPPFAALPAAEASIACATPPEVRTRNVDTAFRLGKARELGEHGAP